MAITGFCLTIAGVPYVLATDGVGTMPTSTSGLWFGAESGVAVVRGALAAEGLRWSERAKPLAGELEVDSMTFTLRDPVAASGIASGEHLLTWLATRNSVNITSTPLASTITSTATSVTVGNGGALTASTWAWLNREAVYVSAIVGNVLTVTRGRLGTRGVAHVVDDTLTPEVFASLPWVQRRKVVLWVVDDGVASPLWMGFCVRAPRLSEGGATFALACDPYLQTIADGPIGGGDTMTLVGYGEGSRSAPDASSTILSLGVQYDGHLPTWGAAWNTSRSFEEMAAGVASRLTTASALRATRTVPFIQRLGGMIRIDIDGAAAFTAHARWLAGEATVYPAQIRGTNRSVAIELSPAPRTAYCIAEGAPCYLAVRSLASAPASWGSTSYDTGTDHATTVQRGLRGEQDRDWWVDFRFVSTGAASSLSPWLQVLESSSTPRKWGLAPRDGMHVIKLLDPPPLTVTYAVRTGHWAYGLRRGALPLVDDCTAETDWDWSTLPDVLQATVGNPVSRTWTFDGRRTAGDLLRECCLLSGVTPVVIDGRPALHAWGWPRAGETAAATLTAADIIGTPVWSTWDDGLANRLSLKSDGVEIPVTDRGSIARYGPGHEIAVTLGGVDQQAPITDDPYTLARLALGRLSLWADPLGSVRVVVSLAQRAVRLGSLVRLTDWITPDGAGERGLAAARGIVYGRAPDYDAGTITLDILLFPRVSYGYAPCARVLSVVSSTVVDIDATPVGSYDYAGGTDGLGGTGTGVQSLFAAGDRVQLLTRDSTTLTSEDRIIDTVTWTGTEWRVAFTVALSAGMQTAIGAGPCDIRGSEYATAGIQAAQKEFMHVADDATLVIDGTADRARVIAP